MNDNQPFALEKYIQATFNESVKVGAKDVKGIVAAHPTWSKDRVLDRVALIALHYYKGVALRANLPDMYPYIEVRLKQRLKEAIQKEIS